MSSNKEKVMDFGDAIRAAKKGHKIARTKWNGKNMFVVYMEPLQLPPFNTQGTDRKVNDRTAKFIGENKPLNCQPYFAMYDEKKKKKRKFSFLKAIGMKSKKKDVTIENTVNAIRKRNKSMKAQLDQL